MVEGCTPESRPPSRLIEGWEERFVGSDPRLTEAADLYREIGFEVLIEPYQPVEDCGGCVECFDDSVSPAMALYVRKGKTTSEASDDLF